MIDEHGQSDGGIVPEKSPNKPQGAEGMEGRPPVKGNEQKHPSSRTQSRSKGMPEVLKRIREAVERNKEDKLTSLYHHVYNAEHLKAAYYGLKKQAAAGVDGETWQHYGEDLDSRLEDLSGRLARGAYRPLPVRRKYIAKPDGRQRPLGVPSLEDKIVQSVTAQLLGSIGESEFMGFSYGFRPGRNAHQALDALTVALQEKRVNWVLDADIRGFFDTISHEWMIKFIEHRVGDQRIVTLLQKWLKAGVLEEEKWTQNEEGTPQGGIVSPILANIYLHYAFDLWAHQWRKQKAQGAIILVRYADDFVVGFEHRHEAEQFKEELAVRLKKFNLELHTEKTRLIEFGRHAAADRKQRGAGKPETFNFLGFTHQCGTTRAGRFVVKRQTMRKRMQNKLKQIKQELRRRMHQSIPEQGRWLQAVLRGHYQYYGVPFNSIALWQFRDQVLQRWKRSLSRRSQRGFVTWERMKRLAKKWLPNPRICHPYPSQRFHVKT